MAEICSLKVCGRRDPSSPSDERPVGRANECIEWCRVLVHVGDEGIDHLVHGAWPLADGAVGEVVEQEEPQVGVTEDVESRSGGEDGDQLSVSVRYGDSTRSEPLTTPYPASAAASAPFETRTAQYLNSGILP